MLSIRLNIEEKTWRGWLRKGRAMCGARPQFGPVSQEAGLAKDHNKAWLHIRIGVRRHWFARRDIPCCKAYFSFVDKQPFDGWLQLKWQSDLRFGSAETTLICGEDRKIPIVLREDHSDCAEMTDFIWFRQQEPKYGVKDEYERSVDKRHLLKAGEYKIIIKIESGNFIWESDDCYIIKVPKSGSSNSHFSITQECRGDG